jgi:hypothetical protein
VHQRYSTAPTMDSRTYPITNRLVVSHMAKLEIAEIEHSLSSCITPRPQDGPT